MSSCCPQPTAGRGLSATIHTRVGRRHVYAWLAVKGPLSGSERIRWGTTGRRGAAQVGLTGGLWVWRPPPALHLPLLLSN